MRGVLELSHGSMSHPLPGVFSSSSDHVPVGPYSIRTRSREQAVRQTRLMKSPALETRATTARPFSGQREHRVAGAERHGNGTIVDDAGADPGSTGYRVTARRGRRQRNVSASTATAFRYLR